MIYRSALRQYRFHARNRLLLLCLLFTFSIAPLVTPSANAERWRTTPTGWWWLHGASESSVNTKADEGFRLTDIEVEQTSPLRFTAVYVRNTGVHAKSWWWYYGTEAYINGKVDEHNARIIDIEPFVHNGQLQFAAVMVAKTGSDNKAWWWYYGTWEYVTGKLDQHNARFIDLDTFVMGGERYFAGAMIANTGADQKDWWYYSNVTADEVKAKLSEHGARLIDIERRTATTFTVVMEKSTGAYWWWYYDVSEERLNFLTAQNGARAIDIETYEVDGQKRFAVVMLNNSNALTSKVAALMRNSADAEAYGFYLKRVDGPVLAALQPNYAYYAASSIKALHHLHALRWAQVPLPGVPDPLAKLSFPITVYTDSCNNAGSQTSEPLVQSLPLMMRNSDNDRTNAIQDYFGQTAINTTAHTIVGMSAATELSSKFGSPCGGPSQDPPNRTTLPDMGLLYERVATGTMLTPQFQQLFHDLMNNESNDNFLLPTVDEEAAKVGLSATQIAEFKAAMLMMHKAGSWGGDTAPFWQTRGGWVSLPVRSGNQIVQRGYVYSLFMEEFSATAPDFTPGTALRELMRGEIHTALNSWKNVIGTIQIGQQASLETSDGYISLNFPAGATTANLHLLHEALAAPGEALPAGYTPLYSFVLEAISDDGSSVATLAQPYTLRIASERIATNAQQLELLSWDDAAQEWLTVPGSVDSSGRFNAQLSHFAQFALVQRPATTSAIYLPLVVR